MATLFMILAGCKPADRQTEQHDIFFGIGNTIKDLVPQLLAFWPGAGAKLHIDAWRKVTRVNGYTVTVLPANEPFYAITSHLFFINLGGYKPNEFEEFHYKTIIAAGTKGEAINQAKKTAFFKHTGFKGATAHIDDQYGIDVDDIFEIPDVLNNETRKQYKILVTEGQGGAEDEVNLGYFKLSSFT